MHLLQLWARIKLGLIMAGVVFCIQLLKYVEMQRFLTSSF